MDASDVVAINTYERAREAYRQRDLRQALYDEGEVVMADVLVNLHGEEHLARRRLENRLFKREHVERYELALFPPVIAATLAPHVAAGEADLVKLGQRPERHGNTKRPYWGRYPVIFARRAAGAGRA